MDRLFIVIPPLGRNTSVADAMPIVSGDVGPTPAAAKDNLTTPSIVVSIKDEIPFFAFLNQIKQEFVSARFLYFEGITSSGAHYSDRDVLLYNPFDYPTYSLAIESEECFWDLVFSVRQDRLLELL